MPEVRGGYIKASYVASGNLSQYRFVAAAGVDVWHSPTSGDVVLGVTLNHPNNNEEATLVTLGHAKVLVASSLGANARVMNGANGFAVVATSGQFVAGRLISNADSGLPAEMIVSGYMTDAIG